jgi:hypothetical protein
MELSLKEVTDILDVVKTIDWYSITLWLALVVPLYYIALKKLLPKPSEIPDPLIPEAVIPDPALQDPALHKPEIPDGGIHSQGLLKPPASNSQPNRWNNVLSKMHRAESYVMFASLALFILGTIIVVIGQDRKERLRNFGWAIKNHMVNTGFYSMAVGDIQAIMDNEENIKSKDIKEIAEHFPQQFSIVYSHSGKTDTLKTSSNSTETLVLSDSLLKNYLISRSEKILDAYLSNDGVIHGNDSDIVSFDTLFQQNNLFTYAVIYKLITDSSRKYTFNLMPNDPKRGFGIIRRKYP